MTELFTASSINGMSLTNRFVRSATWEGLADEDGASTPRLAKLMADLARGGVGLIITSHAFVRRDGRAGPWQLGICGPEHLDGLKTMVDAVHQENGRIVLQLAHAGCKAAVHLTEQIAVGPSAIISGEARCDQLTTTDIRSMADDFARATALACEAGFDGVQIHAAHGYLFSQFLSPHYNRRTDSYGGSTIGRAKALLKTLEAVRREVCDTFPVLVKINADDTLDKGVKPSDMVETAVLLEQAGINAIEISGGCKDGRHLPARKGRIDVPDGEAYYQEAARLYKQRVRIPLILVGGIRSLETAAKLVHEGITDYISMSRPFIRETDLVNRWRSGDIRPSECLSDNLCYRPIRSGLGIRCTALDLNH